MKMNTQYIVIFIIISMFITILGVYLFFYNNGYYGPYESDINRNYQNEFEEELISIAENIEPADSQWWIDEIDNIRIADCVNDEAIYYYSNLIEDIKKNHDYTGFNIRSARFIYKANVQYINNNGMYNSSDSELIEINLILNFSESVNSLNGMAFSHFRTVIFNYDKEIISVIGDDIRPQVLLV